MYGYEIFHEDLMQSLINSVHTGTGSHAYIFEGSEGLGTKNAARLFAAALTCANTEIAPCGSCNFCIESKADTNPDIVYIRPEKDKKSIGAEVMRKVEEDASVKPFAAARKVYIIENGALLTEAAQNVFLKTYEEPPEYAVFIIIIENADVLLQTIRSRSVLVHFPNVSDEAVRKYITEKYPEVQERLDFLVKYCAGVPMAADKLLADESFEALRSSALEKLPLLLPGKALSAFELQKYTEDNKEDFTRIADFWMSFLRDILLLQTGAADGLINTDKRDALRSLSSRTDPEAVVKMLDRLTVAQKMAVRYVNTKAITLWLAL